MINNNFKIEVKTKWTKENNSYSRSIITYELNKNPKTHDGSLLDRLLNVSETIKESVDFIEENELEINAINKETGEEVLEKSALINMLLNFTKFKYEVED